MVAQRPMQGTIYVLGVLPDGTRMLYELSGSEVTIDYDYDELPWWSLSASLPPYRARMEVTGTLVQGRVWTEDMPGVRPDKELEAGRGELEG
jgi:hypothetical protein